MSGNVYTGVCLAAAIGVAAPAVAQTSKDASQRTGVRTVTAIGCLESGSRANSFVLNVLEGGGPVPVGSRVSLTTAGQSEARAHIGQKVQILGTILGARGSSGASSTSTRMYVRDIRQIAPRCVAGTSAPAAAAVVAGTPAGNAVPGAPTGVLSNPSATAGTSVQSTTALTGTLAQTGVSGNATLTGRPAATTATSVTPVNTAASPVPAPAGAASSLPSTSATPANTPVAAQTMAAPVVAAPTTAAIVPGSTTTPIVAAPTTAAPAVTADPPPVAVTGNPAVAQQMTNTSTQIGTLDQMGVTGDALLAGLLSVNVHQVMAAVQAQANVPVQADVIVNVSDIANDLQVQALVQALNTNPQASMNANDLTSALQSAGLIDPNQFVVGVTGSEIYSNTDLTTKLQQRGIISPSETIMSLLPARVYVAQ
jgi:hypothetical protein